MFKTGLGLNKGKLNFLSFQLLKPQEAAFGLGLKGSESKGTAQETR